MLRNVGTQSDSITTASGNTSSVVIVYSTPCSVIVDPSGGASVKVQYTMNDQRDINLGSATWYDWPAGVVTSISQDTIVGYCRGLRQVVTVSGQSTMRVIQ